VQHEYYRSQIEVASPPQLELSGLFASMTRLRAGLASAAERAGGRLVLKKKEKKKKFKDKKKIK